MGMLRSRKGLAGLVIAALGATVLWGGPAAYPYRMRRLLAAGFSVALALGLLIGVAPPSSAAASPGSVTVSVTGGATTLTSTTVQADIGDTFVLQDSTGAGGFFVRNNSGSVSASGVSCATGLSCVVAGGASITLTITAFGTLDVKANMMTTTTLTIVSGSVSPSPTDPALVYPTATVNGNGGSCTGTSQVIKAPGQNASGGTLTAPSASDCTRANYALRGWALSSTATTSAFSPGSTVPIGDESFTLFALWQPIGVEISYDANVGLETQCIDASGKNLISAAERRSQATVVAVRGPTANGAPCYPPGANLRDFAGWALTGNGASIVFPGGLLPDSLKSGDSVTLFAKWVPQQRVPLPTGQLKPARTITITGVRTEVSGKPGIVVTGTTSGFANGERLEPWYKSSEKAKYRATSPYATVVNGEFTWSRQTGIEDSYVFFMSIESIETITKKVKSNDLLIPAQ